MGRGDLREVTGAVHADLEIPTEGMPVVAQTQPSSPAPLPQGGGDPFEYHASPPPQAGDVGATLPSAAAPEPLPVAEPGSSTSEFKVAVGVAIADGMALAIDFGAPITPKQQAAIIAFVASISAVASLYALARGIRKRGTTA